MSSRILRVLLAVLLSFAQSGLICQDLQPPPGEVVPILPEASLKARARLIEKMNSLIIPTVQFNGATIGEAIAYLREKSRELDTSPAPAGVKGVNIILRGGDDTPLPPVISLGLKDVPLHDALRYVTELAQMKYKVEADSVLVVPLWMDISEMFIRSFRVPPDFLNIDARDPNAPLPIDPFAAPTDRPPGTPPPLPSSKRILEAQGITFPEGSSAFFNPATGLLTVTNTQPNLDLVESFTGLLRDHTPSSIAQQLIIVEGPGELIRTANAAASRVADARQELDTLLAYAKNPGSNVHVVADAFLEGRAGVRSTTYAVSEHVHATGLDLDSKSRATTAWDMEPLGLSLEVGLTLDANGRTLDNNSLNIHFNPLTPSIRQISVTEPLTGHDAELPVSAAAGAEFRTSIVSTIGTTKFIGVTKPVGLANEKADLLWAAFLTSSLRRVEVLPQSSRPATNSEPLPAGMRAAIFDAPEGLFELLMNDEPEPVSDWIENQGVSFAKGATMEQRGERLHVINTPSMIEAIGGLIDYAKKMARYSLVFTLHTVQAPADSLRELTRKTMTTSADDTPMLAAIEAAVERGEARFIDSVVLEGRPGWRSIHQSLIEHSFISGFGINASNEPDVEFDMRPVGSTLEIESTLSADGYTVILSLTHELHSAPPETRGAHFRDPASGKPFAMPATDFHVLKTATSLEMIRGGTKLVSLHKPTGRDAEGLLWATFLKCDAVPQVTKSKRAAKPVRDIPDSDELITRSYKVPPDFLSHQPPITRRRQSAPQPFEALGVTFPEGSSASFNPAASTLVVRNTRKNLALIEAWVRDVVHALPKTVTITTHVIQAPGPLLRRLAAHTGGKINHRAELDELLAAVKKGDAQSLGTNRIETKPGTRATTLQGTKNAALTEVSITKEGVPEIITEERDVGFKVEVEPVVESDGQLVGVEIATDFHTAQPIEHRERILDTQGRRLEFPLTDYQIAHITTATTIPDGCARLISLYKPTGKPKFENEDILQAIFITCDILRAGK